MPRSGESIPAADPWLQKLAADRVVFAAQLAERQNQAEADLNLSYWPEPGDSPLLQPPKPPIPPSARVLERVNQRDVDMEAAT